MTLSLTGGGRLPLPLLDAAVDALRAACDPAPGRLPTHPADRRVAVDGPRAAARDGLATVSEMPKPGGRLGSGGGCKAAVDAAAASAVRRLGVDACVRATLVKVTVEVAADAPPHRCRRCAAPLRGS